MTDIVPEWLVNTELALGAAICFISGMLFWCIAEYVVYRVQWNRKLDHDYRCLCNRNTDGM